LSPIRDAIEQRFTEPGIGNRLGPFREGQIGGDDDRGLLGAFSNHLEQELSANLGQRYVTHFIERDQIVTGPPRQRATELQLMPSLDQFVNQRRSGSEADAALLAASGYRKSREQMGLPVPLSPIKMIGSAFAM